MAATAFGDIHVVLGQAPPTITMYDKTGSSLGSAYVNPDLAEASLETVFDGNNYTNSAGEVCARRTKGEYLRATFQVVPKDSGVSQAVSDALKAAAIPGEGFSFVVSGMKVIKAGSFSDAFNNSTSTSPWFVESGSIRGSAQEPAGVTYTAVRFAGITSNTPVTE